MLVLLQLLQYLVCIFASQ